MATLKTICGYFGGKGHLVQRLIPLMSVPHAIYAEPFGGGGSVILNKDPVDEEYYNDADPIIVQLFSILCGRKDGPFFQFMEDISLIPFSKEELNYFHACLKHPLKGAKAIPSNAVALFTASRLSISGLVSAATASYGRNLLHSRRGMGGNNSSRLSAIRELQRIRDRMEGVNVSNQDFRVLIPRVDSKRTIIYADPPYVPSTRRSGGYRFEMSLKDHEDLVKILLKVKGGVVLSGYPCDVYKPLEKAGWERRDWNITTAVTPHRAGAIEDESRKEQNARTEAVWINPALRAWKG